MRSHRREGLPAFVPRLMLEAWAGGGYPAVAARWFITEANARRRIDRLKGPILYQQFGPPPYSSAQNEALKRRILRDAHVVNDLE